MTLKLTDFKYDPDNPPPAYDPNDPRDNRRELVFDSIDAMLALMKRKTEQRETGGQDLFDMEQPE
jgi:hypothetical protein